jgi:tetratricopeptide (TPR) repeat protein
VAALAPAHTKVRDNLLDRLAWAEEHLMARLIEADETAMAADIGRDLIARDPEANRPGVARILAHVAILMAATQGARKGAWSDLVGAVAAMAAAAPDTVASGLLAAWNATPARLQDAIHPRLAEIMTILLDTGRLTDPPMIAAYIAIANRFGPADQAEGRLLTALSELRRRPDGTAWTMAWLYGQLAHHYDASGQGVLALRAHRGVIKHARPANGDDWLRLMVAANQVSVATEDAREAWWTARLAVKAYGRCRNRDPKTLSALYSVLTQREVVLVPTESTVQIALANVKMAVRAHGRAGPEAAHAVSLLAQVYRQVGALDRASFWFKRALRLYRAIGDPLFVDVLRDALRDSLLAQGRRVEAAGV